MKKTLLCLQVLLLILVSFSVSLAQNYTLSVPSSSWWSSVSVTPIAGSSTSAPEPGRVYYGATPSYSSSKPVLVFIHGYTSKASTWWESNDMYLKAYNAGYRTAFVSVHPDKSMWVNGQMFAGMINRITARYGVAKVVVVAHSKGGVDSDAALVHYGAHPKVDRVVTLGTPHYGTALADLAQSGWVWWLADVFGQYNDATYVLQTGYMNYYRSQTDGHVNNSRVNFRSLGAWGYSGLLLTSGWYLNANGGGAETGGNDGVVPYYSTKRPRAYIILPGYGDPRSNLNHSDVQKGNYVWQYIVGQLPSGTFAQASPESQEITNPNAVAVSKSQVISSDKGERTFIIEKNVTSVQVEVRQAEAGADYMLAAPNGAPVTLKNKTAAARPEDGMGNFKTSFEITNPQPGTYTIRSAKPFVAVVTSEQGAEMQLSSDLNNEKFVYAAGETMNYKVALSGDVDFTAAKVTGVLLKTGSLEGTSARANDAVVVEFARNANNEYVAAVKKNLAPGVYNLTINAENKNFRKTVITSVAVVADQRKGFIDNTKEGMAFLSVYPNPSGGDATIAFEITEKDNARLKVYDMMGRVVRDFDLSGYEAGKHSINWTAEGDLQNGAYLCELSNGKERVTKVVMLVR